MTRTSNTTRRLPLPPRVSNMTEAQVPALAVAKAFVERLGDLPLESWLAIGRAVTASRSAASYSGAWPAVEQAIARQDLGLAAWHIRDDIETLVYLVSHAGELVSRADRSVFAAAHGAAEDAALALLVRDHVSADKVDRLCAPFASYGWLDGRPASSPSAPDSVRSGDSTEIPGTRMLNTLPPPSRSA
jgi:hypothetical protein